MLRSQRKTIPCYTWRRRWRRLETIRRPCTSRRLCGDISRGWRRSRTTKLASGCDQWTRLTAANNVIPAEARANLNVRLLPGDSVDALISELNKLVNDPQVRLEVQPNAGL